MRVDPIKDWLAGTQWADGVLTPITGDASARKYARLSLGDTPLIVMDAPPEICGSQSAFVSIAQHLVDNGFAAPKILLVDKQQGLILMEDLGPTDFATHLRHAPEDELHLYQAAKDVLDRLRDIPIPPGLPQMTPDEGADMLDITFEWAAPGTTPNIAEQIKGWFHQQLTDICPVPTTTSLRDFHAENLIWRPHLEGLNRVGLLDFQDAFVTHPLYDVASLIRDVRRDVSKDLLEMLVPDPADRRAFHVLALQRNLRIVGVFHRLARRDGKMGYLDLLPKVWQHIHADLASDVAQDLAPMIHAAFEVPIT